MSNMDEFDANAFLAELDLEAEGQRLRLDEMVRRGDIIIMPFGIYKGRRIDLIPDDYLVWAVKKCSHMKPALRTAIMSHLRAR